MDRRNDLRTNPPALTRRPFPAHINPSVVFVSSDRHHLESVITIPGMRRWDGSGVCLYLKRLEKAKFCWPRIGHHRVQMNPAQNGLEAGPDRGGQAAGDCWVKTLRRSESVS
ncbi:IS66 family insertion sequence element accessory protein TnpB [Bradyrhizobium sp. 166]|nr:IS66 family insertion sequence element accessory protein TnpB [Bradyrhizobium sp. 166]